MCQGLKKHLQAQPRDQTYVQAAWKEHALPLSAVTAGMISNTVILVSPGKKKIYTVINEERRQKPLQEVFTWKGFSNTDPQ